MEPKPPSLWHLAISLVITTVGIVLIVVGPVTPGTFSAWWMTLVWLANVVLWVIVYVDHRVRSRAHQRTSSTDEEPTP